MSEYKHHKPTGTRIYAQMKPGSGELDTFKALQATLPSQQTGRLIGPDELHLTLIHFGKADDVYANISRRSDICREAFDEHLASYVTRTTALLPAKPLRLSFDKFELFGPKHTALAASFKADETLSALHTKLFGALLRFLKDIGIKEPLEFMKNDPNFKHAMTCRPHVTLYKGYAGEVPHGTLATMQFESMNVVY